MLPAMRSAVVFGVGVAVLAACGTDDLEPIHAPPAVDEAPVPHEGGLAEAPSDAGLTTVDSARCKRGMASNVGPSAALVATASVPGIAWWYNWAAQSPGGDVRVEFVPMIWGGKSLDDAVPGGSHYLLGFNEPDFKSQSNLTAQQAAAYWPMVQAKAKAAGLPVVSPGVNFCGSATDTSQCSDPTVTDPYTYLKDFFAACSGCTVDYVAVHAYECDLPSLRDYIEGNVDAGGTLQGFGQFGKPIWITELACDSTHSVADQKAYMQAVVPYLEGNPNVFRYAWFNAKNIPNAEIMNADGTLTDLGTTYVGLAQDCP
jgi:Glycosyl hydrolase catalytic core